MDFNNQTSCKNCDEPLTTPFCGHCGQPKAVRITFKELMRTIQMGLLEFRSPFLHTFKMLTIAPGKVCRDYVEGKRERYFNPIKYALWVVTVTVFISAFTNNSLSDFQAFGEISSTKSEDDKQFSATLRNLIDSSQFFIVFFYAAVFALVLRIFFRKQDFNIFELYILAILPSAHITWVTAILVGLGWYNTPSGIAVTTLIGFVFCIYAYTTFFDGKWLPNLVRSLVSYILAMLLFVFSFGLSIGIAAGVKHAQDQEVSIEQQEVVDAFEETKAN
ncbi:DUF3667 domain-containing protein [Thalassotalea marina]|uniref:DUF3667 domain-containing protein n=1 Tax=Thalassotalea marina TaxID=1673741 RepID=A0A919EIX7_9GAMM|nr:DUF3667 domain-containing protein [Thalassotalea marina]GHF84660.1 hypothetical protein GCM10017161_10170 [Thalassotalea marina]